MNWKLSIAHSDRKILAVALGLYVAAVIPLLFFGNGKATLFIGSATILFVSVVVLKRPETREALRREFASATETVGGFISWLLAAALYLAGLLIVIYALVKFVRWAWYN